MVDLRGFNRREQLGKVSTPPPDGRIALANLTKSRHSAKEMTFGYPGKERYYLFGNWERYLRIFPANPGKLAEGTWRSYEGGIDVVFRLRKEIRVPFLKAVEEDLSRVMGCVEKL